MHGPGRVTLPVGEEGNNWVLFTNDNRRGTPSLTCSGCAIEKGHQQRAAALGRNHLAIIAEINNCLLKWKGNRHHLRRPIKMKDFNMPGEQTKLHK